MFTIVKEDIQLIRTVDVPPPWLARVAAIKEAASHNVDTERKVIRMSEELKDLLREVKIRVSHAFTTVISSYS